MPFSTQGVWCICVPLSPSEGLRYSLGVDSTCFALGKEPELEFTLKFLWDCVMSHLLRPKPSVVAAGKLLDLLHRATWFNKWQQSNLCLLFSAASHSNVGPAPAAPMSVITTLGANFLYLTSELVLGFMCRTVQAGTKLPQIFPCFPVRLLHNVSLGSSPSFSLQLYHACSKSSVSCFKTAKLEL